MSIEDKGWEQELSPYEKSQLRNEALKLALENQCYTNETWSQIHERSLCFYKTLIGIDKLD
jgi:hypothetical protein